MNPVAGSAQGLGFFLTLTLIMLVFFSSAFGSHLVETPFLGTMVAAWVFLLLAVLAVLVALVGSRRLPVKETLARVPLDVILPFAVFSGLVFVHAVIQGLSGEIFHQTPSHLLLFCVAVLLFVAVSVADFLDDPMAEWLAMVVAGCAILNMALLFLELEPNRLTILTGSSLVFVAFGLAQVISGKAIGWIWVCVPIGCALYMASRMVVATQLVMVMTALAIVLWKDRGWVLRLRFLIGLGLLGCVVVLVVWLNADFLRVRMFGRGDGWRLFGLRIHTSGRLELWAGVLESWRSQPWFGLGAPVPEAFYTTERGFDHTHNDYLRVLHQTGLLGLLCFGAFLLATARRCVLALRQLESLDHALIPVTTSVFLAGFLVFMLTDNPLVHPWIVFPLFVLLALTCRLQRRTSASGGTDPGP